MRSIRRLVLVLSITSALAPSACAVPVGESSAAVAPIARELHVLEAELPVTLVAPMQVIVDPTAEASNTEYVIAPNGAGGGIGEAIYAVEITDGGTYRLWGRFLAPTGGDNSVWLSVDGATEVLWSVSHGPAWTWNPLRDNGSAVIDLSLAPGPHTIRVRNREDGTALDKLLLIRDTSYVPFGSAGDAENVYVASYEAEAGTLTPPFTTGVDVYASGATYAHVPNGDPETSSSNNAGTAGAITLTVNVPRAGRTISGATSKRRSA
jgi:hypothetical protein